MRRVALVLLMVAGACGGQPPAPITVKPLTQARSGIVNGTVDTGDPAVVEVYYQDNGTGQGFVCTGELIGPHTVLSAGHCTNTKTASSPSTCPNSTSPIDYANANNEPFCTQANPQNCAANTLWVAVLFNSGCTPSSSGPSCEQQAFSAGKYIVVDELRSAPSYSPCAQQLSDDIGVIHLTSSTMVGGQAEPALMAVNTTDLGPAGTTLPTVRFVGFGITGGGLQDSGIKRQVSKNNVQVANSGELYEQLVTGDTGLTCSGDSGGPSLMTLNGTEQIIGVTSRGDANCQQAGIDTRVDPFIGWINQVMASHNDGQVNSGVPTTTSSTSSTSSTGTSGTTGSGTGALCTSCAHGSDCASGVCVNIGTNSAPQDVCSDHTCNTSSDCSSGESCFPVGTNLNICFPSSQTCPGSTSGTSTTAASTTGTTGSGAASTTTTGSAGASTTSASTTGSAGASTTTTGSAGASTTTTGGASGSGNGSGTSGGGTTARAAPTTGTANVKSGGCGSSSPGELGLAFLALAPLLRRRRAAL